MVLRRDDVASLYAFHRVWTAFDVAGVNEEEVDEGVVDFAAAAELDFGPAIPVL